jgi:hypothetical protein
VQCTQRWGSIASPISQSRPETSITRTGRRTQSHSLPACQILPIGRKSACQHQETRCRGSPRRTQVRLYDNHNNHIRGCATFWTIHKTQANIHKNIQFGVQCITKATFRQRQGQTASLRARRSGGVGRDVVVSGAHGAGHLIAHVVLGDCLNLMRTK